jgi:ribonuclease III
MANYEALQECLGYPFNSIRLLKQALTHSSYVNEAEYVETEDNEKLEFLGDALLGLVISDMLYTDYPHFREGDLAKLKSYVVSEQFLAELARELCLGDYLLLGKGEKASGGREKSSLLANSFEALIAAVYLDGGIERAREFIYTRFNDKIQKLVQEHQILDHKSLLQEHTQMMFNCVPVYQLLSKSGPDHDKTFEVQLSIGDKIYSIGRGKSKKEAEQMAAKQTLMKLNVENNRPDAHLKNEKESPPEKEIEFKETYPQQT